jgi:Mg/Co/Ni transporter MgtE
LLKPDKVDGLAPATSLAKRTLDVAVARTPWLGLFLTGLLLCASVMHHFEKLLAKRVELAFFVPMLIGHGGNSGVQAVSNVIRSIAVDGSAHPAKMLTVESAAGLLQSIVLSAFIAPALRFSMNIPMPVCIVVALSLPALGFFANTCGAALPYIAVRVGLDPAVVVGPMMTTLVDTVGVLIYLSIAMAILGDLDDASGSHPPSSMTHNTHLTTAQVCSLCRTKMARTIHHTVNSSQHHMNAHSSSRGS